MKAFHFKLERILSLRKHREREWEVKLAEITGRCVNLEREIDERKRKKSDMFLHPVRFFEIGEYLSTHRYMARLEQEIDKKVKELTSCLRTREEIQAEYLKHSRERKVLDNLREKRMAEYMHTQKVEEVKQVDDINTGRAARAIERVADRES